VGLNLSNGEGFFARFFLPDGTFLRYKVLRSPEDLAEVISRLPVKKGGTLLLHADGPLKELSRLKELLKDYRLEVLEVIEGSAPRFFSKKEKIKGLYYKLSPDTLFLATYEGLKRGTHRPITLRRVEGTMPVETHARIVLSFTLLNYASFQTPKLPATTHGGRRISELLLKGIEPGRCEGDGMFWL